MSTPLQRFRPFSKHNISQTRFWRHLPAELRDAILVVAEVLPFRVNEYVLENLIDWSAVPEDPIFRLVFPAREMLLPGHYEQMSAAVRSGDRARIDASAHSVRTQLNPHPAGQTTANVPLLDDGRIEGLQHKYRETVLVFPRSGQTCHAYCSFCFRWPQFVGDADYRMQLRSEQSLAAYLEAHDEVTDVLITGGDPLVMSTRALSQLIDVILFQRPNNIAAIRIGTKALTYWPMRFVSDPDADELLRLFEKICRRGCHLAVMAHVNHPRELQSTQARTAIERIRAAGAVLRVQAPLARQINDDPGIWAALWRESVRLGMMPYYMFMQRDTGAKHYFDVPLARAVNVFADAQRVVSGLARTARGPVMSTGAGKVCVESIIYLGDRRAFALKYLQAREPDLVGQIFFGEYDSAATWFDQLRPVAATDARFFLV